MFSVDKGKKKIWKHCSVPIFSPFFSIFLPQNRVILNFLNLSVLHKIKGLLMQDWVFRLGLHLMNGMYAALMTDEDWEKTWRWLWANVIFFDRDRQINLQDMYLISVWKLIIITTRQPLSIADWHFLHYTLPLKICATWELVWTLF